jgi:IS6 family transposase
MEKRLRRRWRRPQSTSWRVDETYVKVRGRWTYLYRALDKHGNTIDFYLSPTRNAKAAKRFLGKALNGLKDWEKPKVINTDKASTYRIAVSELKAEGKCPVSTEHRQVKYLNNVIEADHGSAGIQDAEDRLRDHHGIRGDACSTQGPGGDLQLHARHPGRGSHRRTRFRHWASALAEAVALIREKFNLQPV